MLLQDENAFAHLLVCPACKSRLSQTGEDAATLVCCKADCHLFEKPFLRAAKKSVLVDFENSVIERSTLEATDASTLVPRGGGWRELLNRVANGTNRITPFFARDIVRRLRDVGRAEDRRPILLIIGGGAIGAGADDLYGSEDVDVLAFDIYTTVNVNFVADAHAVPLADGCVDAIWIQAVLEHVADPPTVVSEIRRVLRTDGLLFADTPFMWPVHERAYDFTRYTPSGHRWLFRDFDVLAAGTSSGPGTSFVLSLRYLAASLSRSTKIGHIVALPFFWVRYLDQLCDLRRGLDAAAGIFFFGRKRKEPVSRSDLIAFYDEQLALQAQVPSYRRLSSRGQTPSEAAVMEKS